MKEAIGSVPLYNIIIVFIVITFAFLSATLSYTKAFKVNSNIAKQLERYEGYNDLSEKDINQALSGLGYKKESGINCPDKKIGNVITGRNKDYPICIYKSSEKNGYFNYGIVTFIYIDLPIISKTLKIPVYTETERIYKFSS